MLLASLPANTEAIAIGSPMLYAVFFCHCGNITVSRFFYF